MYLDTSVLVKRYVAEPDSDEVDEVVVGFTLVSSELALGEVWSALLAKERFAQVFQPGTHASTFGGNPVTTAAACAVYDELTTGGAVLTTVTFASPPSPFHLVASTGGA